MEFFKSRNFDKKNFNRNSNHSKNYKSFRNSGRSRNDGREESATVTCADCGTECQIPFIPKTDRPVYCSECFRQNKPSDNDRDSRHFESSLANSPKNELKSKQSRTTKFLKKQETFYSNGSDKFYASLKEKLFEILGGKICYSCGFKDERALGISLISDKSSFDSIRRGGFASSWGKYISDPNLAREELKVLCLNCNEIREPVSKQKDSNPKQRKKKSKYFPR